MRLSHFPQSETVLEAVLCPFRTHVQVLMWLPIFVPAGQIVAPWRHFMLGKMTAASPSGSLLEVGTLVHDKIRFVITELSVHVALL